MTRFISIAFWLALVLVLTFVTLPLIVVLAASLSPTMEVTFLPWHWTLRWYGDMWTAKWLDPFLLSIEIALIVALLSGLFGSLGAYVVAYEKCPGHNAIMAFLLSPLAVPQIVKGVAIVLFLSSAGLYRMLGTPGLIIAHVVLTMPFVVRMVATALFNYDKRLDRAARILGAGKWQRIRYVLLPLIKPGLFSGMAFAFIISFNDVSLSLFLVRPGQITLPITIMNFMEYSLDPILAAVNVASLSFIIAALFIFEKVGGFSAQLHGGSK